MTCYLLINTHSIQSMVHDVHPPILGGQDKQGHESLAKVIKVVFLVYPSILFILQTFKLVSDILIGNIRPVTVKEQPFEELKINLVFSNSI